MLKVLIIGSAETLDESKELLNSLNLMGYEIGVIGAITQLPSKTSPHQDSRARNRLLRDVGKRLESDPPDIVILTHDDEGLRKNILCLLPPQTTFLDTFALKIIKGLKDTTSQLVANQTRIESLELIKEVLMSGPEISIMSVDEDLKITEINNAILERTKTSRQDCIGRPCHLVLRKEMKPCHARGENCVVQDVIRTGRSVHTVREEKRNGEPPRYFTISSYPLREDERGKRNVLIVWKDVSRGMTVVLDRQAQNIKESFSQRLWQDKMVALGKLASAAVHEINNPIQGILTFAKLMRGSFDKESLTREEMDKFRSYLDLVAVESERCGRILQGLLSFSRKRDLKRSAVQLTKILDDISLLMGNRMKLQRISLCIDKKTNLPFIYCDGDQIKQALLNIVLNAVEVMPNGGLITILAEPHPDKKHLVIMIQDTGPGIPETVQRHIFEPFYSTKKDAKGVGLGLSIVYGILAQHGGMIEVESQVGEGTSFVLTIPISEESQERN
jgi:two-component system, NtrC family, sensor kinase